MKKVLKNQFGEVFYAEKSKEPVTQDIIKSLFCDHPEYKHIQVSPGGGWSEDIIELDQCICCGKWINLKGRFN